MERASRGGKGLYAEDLDRLSIINLINRFRGVFRKCISKHSIFDWLLTHTGPNSLMNSSSPHIFRIHVMLAESLVDILDETAKPLLIGGLDPGQSLQFLNCIAAFGIKMVASMFKTMQ